MNKVVGLVGFEPTIFPPQTERDSQVTLQTEICQHEDPHVDTELIIFPMIQHFFNFSKT